MSSDPPAACAARGTGRAALSFGLALSLAGCGGGLPVAGDGAESAGLFSAAPDAPSAAAAGDVKLRLRGVDQPIGVVLFAFELLDEVQNTALATGFQYCGYVIGDGAGDFRRVGPNAAEAGPDTALCVAPPLPGGRFQPVAHYRTQSGGPPPEEIGAPPPAPAVAEIPASALFSLVESDGLDAFLATPRGRLWHIDAETGVARLICGPEDCLASAPERRGEASLAAIQRLDRNQAEALAATLGETR